MSDKPAKDQARKKNSSPRKKPASSAAKTAQPSEAQTPPPAKKSRADKVIALLGAFVVGLFDGGFDT